MTDTVEKQELKPCPFCGGEAMLKEYSKFAIDADYRYALVECSKRCIRGKEVQAVFSADDPDFGNAHTQIAIEAWNRRAS